ncbi:MAG: polysulfide reductase NrfD [Syntrophales bacterium]|nr:polysulfide reductase NrfD [Syntrophales bacterium]MDD5641212.1 polysulfide reductase NrfD [Syntrophales bacterium]
MNEPIQWISWIKHGVVFGYLIAMYMFLISMAVGAHLVTLFAKVYYRDEDFLPLEKVGTFLPMLILLLMPLLLAVDMTHPERAYTMYYHWNWTATVAWGAYIMPLCVITYAFHSFYLFRPEMMVAVREGRPGAELYRMLLRGKIEEGTAAEIRQRRQKAERLWANISIVFSFLALIYVGMRLSAFKGRVMVSSLSMVFVFMSLAASSGTGFMILLGRLKTATVPPTQPALIKQNRFLVDFGVILKYALLAQLVIWVLYLIQLNFTGTGGKLAAYIFLGGPRSFYFWAFQVVIGMLLPLALVMVPAWRQNVGASVAASVATMLGAFFAVANLSVGSQLIPLTHLEWEQLAPEPLKMAFGIIVMVVLLLLFLASYKILPYETPVSQKSEA